MPDLDATKSGTSANAYCDEDFADEYLDNIYGADEWADVSDDDKARLLVTATKQIEELALEYDPATTTQALKFPVDNTDDSDEDGWDEAQEACVIQAFYLLNHFDAIQEAESLGIAGVKSESASGRSFTGFNSLRQIAPAARKKLASFLDLSMSVYRG